MINSGSYVAMWSSRRRGEIVITDPFGNVAGCYPVEQEGDRPGWQMLLHTGWSAYPGAEWQEEPLGEWSLAVFRHPLPRSESDQSCGSQQ